MPKSRGRQWSFNVLSDRKKRRGRRRDMQGLSHERGRIGIQRLPSYLQFHRRLRGRHTKVKVWPSGKKNWRNGGHWCVAHTARPHHWVSLAEISRFGQQVQEADRSRHRTPVGRFSLGSHALFCVSWRPRTLLWAHQQWQRPRVQMLDEAEVQSADEPRLQERVNAQTENHCRRLQGRPESGDRLSKRYYSTWLSWRVAK